jgi:hypothetical protein
LKYIKIEKEFKKILSLYIINKMETSPTLESLSALLEKYTEPTYPITKNENFDDDNMKYLLCDERFNKKDRTRLSNYNKHRRSGSRMLVEYKLADELRDHNLGRLYPSESLGLQSYRFDIRNPLTAKWYWDLDMENSHPCIAEKICKLYDLPHQAITHYINNRNDCLNLISSDRKIAKTEIIKMLYGGEITLYNEFYENCEGVVLLGDPFVKSLQYEFNSLSEEIWKRHTHLHKIKSGGKILNKKSNAKSSLLSIILQTEERKLLMKIDYLLSLFNRNFDIFIHDGGLVPKLEGETEFPQEILEMISIAITTSTGIKTRLTQKQITYDWVPIKKMSPYEVMKIEFEKKHFYVGSQVIYEMDNGEIEYVKINDLKNRLKHKKWTEENLETGKKSKHYFVEQWLEDETRPKFERMDFIPNREACPENVYNKFKGFEVEKLASEFTNDVSKEEIELEIDLILKHITHLTGGDENGSKFVLNILANIIQNPHKKCEVAILFRDENGFLRQGGGTGKSLFTNQFYGSKIIGDNYMIEVQDNSDLYGTFNSQYAGKLLAVIEECDGENHSNADKLKSRITSKKMNVNTKNVAQFSMNDYTTYIFNTNNRNPLPIKQGNRRLCVFDANQEIRCNTAYFDALVERMESKKSQYYFYLYLKHYVTTYSSPIQFQTNIPINSEYIQMCQMNAPVYLKWITYNVKYGLVRNDTVRNIYNNYVNWIKEHRETKDDRNILSETSFGKLLESDGNILSEDSHYSLNAVGDKKKSCGLMVYSWNIDNLVNGLKTIHLLEDSFTYQSIEEENDNSI